MVVTVHTLLKTLFIATQGPPSRQIEETRLRPAEKEVHSRGECFPGAQLLPGSSMHSMDASLLTLEST